MKKLVGLLELINSLHCCCRSQEGIWTPDAADRYYLVSLQGYHSCQIMYETRSGMHADHSIAQIIDYSIAA